MRKLYALALGVLLASFAWSIALAQDEAAAAPATETAAAAPAAETAAAAPATETPAAKPMTDSYGFNADDVAVNQGAVAYWYAHGYANAFGGFPAKWADLTAKGLPLRKFQSPHTGDDIDFDDGSLDFDGDMTYKSTGCDVEIQVKTTQGVVTLPGTLSSVSLCPNQGCSPYNRCGSCRTKCCDVTICGWESWGCMSDQDAVCKIIGWMMWRSFETYECRYGSRPCDDMVWIASGFAPIDKNWKELAPFMDIEYIWGKCALKKAKVHCCQPCVAQCQPKCNTCNTCQQPKCNTCGKCHKCGGTAPCGTSPCTSGSCSRCGH